MELRGSCEYCGQHRIIDVADGNLTEAEINALVTDQCDCVDAKTARRKAEREQKISDFINSEVDPNAADLFVAAVDSVRTFQVESVIITDNDGWKTKISVNSDGYLVFEPKKTISKKTKI